MKEMEKIIAHIKSSDILIKGLNFLFIKKHDWNKPAIEGDIDSK